MKNNLMVMNNKEQWTIGSREVAEMMEVQHKDLLKKIEGINEDFNVHKIVVVKYWIESTYIDIKGEQRKEYLVTKRGCEFLANKATGTKGNLFTDRYMDRFEELESQVKSQIKQEYHVTSDSIERAKRWIEEETSLSLEEKVKEQQSILEYFDKYMLEKGGFTTTELAKRVGQVMGGRMSARTLNIFLYVAGIVDEKDKSYEITQNYAEKGWHCYGKKLPKQLKWTTRAMREIPEFIVKQFKVIKE